MSSNAFNKNGQIVNIADSVSIVAKVVSVSGVGSLAQVTCQAPYDPGTFVAQANDAYAVQHPTDATHPAASIDGKTYGLVGNDITVLGVCTAISGSGQNAILTVLLKTSQVSINTAAGNVSSAA